MQRSDTPSLPHTTKCPAAQPSTFSVMETTNCQHHFTPHPLRTSLDSIPPEIHTVSTSTIWLDKRLGHLAILNLQSIALAAHASKDGSAVKVDIKRLGESRRGIGN